MRLNTINNKALEKVTYALENIENYMKDRNVAFLKNAEISLEAALVEDPDFLDANFYCGLTKDLIGRAADSHIYFERIINEVNDSKIKNESLYNLAVSYYHRYGHQYLHKAENYFNNLITKTDDDILKILSYANLAQVYAMWMIPSKEQKSLIKDKVEQDKVFSHIKEKFEKFSESEKKVRKFLKKKSVESNYFRQTLFKIKATIDNARGMALMYYSDYLCKDEEDKSSKLHESLQFLYDSEKSLNNDWANTCDLASVYWRLALITQSLDQKQIYLDESIRLLNIVIKSLRLDYGFALYELGRIYRTQGLFNKSIEYFDKALLIEEKYRDVGNRNVEFEKQRAISKDTSFP